MSTDGVTMRPVAIATDGGEYGVAVHPMGNITMSFDHRANDGAYCSAFLAKVKQIVQTRDWSTEVAGIVPQPARTTTPAALTARAEPTAPTTPVEFPRDEVIEDFRRACVSRAIDDREINLQRQSRVFFQISGAGHEALLLGLARHLRSGYDWFFPYYRDQALMLGLGISAYQILLQAVGSADDPASGGRQMPSHWGSVEHHVVTQSSPTGTPMPARGRVRRGGAVHLAPTAPSRLCGIRRRGHLRVPRRGRDVGGRVLGEPQHRVHAPPPGRVRRRRQRIRHLGAVERSVTGADLRARARLPRSRHPPPRRHRLLRGAGARRVDHQPRPRRRRTGTHPRHGDPSLLPLGRGHAERSTDRPRSSTTSARATRSTRMQTELIARGLLTAEEAEAVRAEAIAHVAEAARQALEARRPDPATVTQHVIALPSIPTPASEPEGGEVVAFGEAIKRTLHEQMAERRAHPCLRRRRRGRSRDRARERRGQGRCVRHDPRPPASLRHRPLLQHAARRGEHRRPRGRAGAARSAARARDPVLRLHLARDAAAQERGGDDPLALERSVDLPDGRAGADRRLPHRRLDLAQPERRVDLRPHPRSADRLPVARARRGRSATRGVPLRGPRALPRAQAPAPPALHARSVSRRGLRAPLRASATSDGRAATSRS